MWIYLPFEPCPCGSRKKALTCCLRRVGRRAYYHRRPARLTRPPLWTDFARKDCFLAFWRDCSQGISGEHYISESVIRASQPRALAHEKTIRLQHPRWAPEYKNIGIANLKSNILCKSHNEMLSPLDTEAGKLWSAMRHLIDVDVDPFTCSRVQLFNGYDIERWMMKTLLSSFFAGYENQSNKSKLQLPVPTSELAAKLIDVSLWDNNAGVYVDTVIDHHASLGFRTINRDNIIYAAEFYMFGIRMIFLPCPVDDPKVIVPKTARHRPDGFAFRIGSDVKFIGFSWNYHRSAGGSEGWIQLARGPLGGQSWQQ